MSEAVRLVIWDLDETYWRGTLTEGGITEYVREHHDLVIELCRRGIMSSICSKNDGAIVKAILEREGIAQYFIFPSISWGPKAQRLAAIIEAVQLRPTTVMFIDDNHLNRAEAADLIPAMQIEDEHFISQILADPRFKGKNDNNLTRLAQYKLLEKRKQDEVQSEGNNEQFLRDCDIRVTIEYDVMKHIDRAVELINRTNQLNFTKTRLPESPELARSTLTKLLGDPFRQSGLIRVVDKYGDYGFIGFYMVRNGVIDTQAGCLVQQLEHFCFSCRTLGMLVEAWVYDYLQRPRINIVGEVLTDIAVPRTIDWIRTSSQDDLTSDAGRKMFSEIRVHGGCEANSIAHYLAAHTESLVVTGNFHSGATFSRVNGSTLLLSACDRFGAELDEESANLGIPVNMLATDFFGRTPAKTAFVIGGQMDVNGSRRYRHKQHGWEILLEPHGIPGLDLPAMTKEDVLAHIAALSLPESAKTKIANVALHIQEAYSSVSFSHEQDLGPAMAEIFRRVPVGSKLVMVTDHSRVRLTETLVRSAPWAEQYDLAIRSIAAAYSYVGVVSFKDHIQNDEEIKIGGNHYDRMVYLRMADAILSMLKALPVKTSKYCNIEPGDTLRLRMPEIDNELRVESITLTG